MSSRWGRGAVAALLAVSLSGPASGCAARGAPGDGPSPAGLDPTGVVALFLEAVNANQIGTMGLLFGTREGSVFRVDDRANVEQRMYALASVLRHSAYTIQDSDAVPGRSQEAIRLTVLMTIGNRQIPVPFTMVRSRDGWLVEQIGIEAITSQP